MENNEAPAPAVSLTKFVAPCDGCDETHNLLPDPEGRMLLCDECLREYAAQQ